MGSRGSTFLLAPLLGLDEVSELLRGRALGTGDGSLPPGFGELFVSLEEEPAAAILHQSMGIDN